MKRLYIAAYHQSKFGKLMGMTVPEIVKGAVEGACGEISAAPAQIDVGSIGATCNFSLNEQGLLAGLVAGIAQAVQHLDQPRRLQDEARSETQRTPVDAGRDHPALAL